MTETEEGRTYCCTRCGDTYTDDLAPLPTVPVDPPVDVMSLEAREEETTPTSTCGGTQRVLVSTVTQEHTYFYASGKLLREIITTTSGDTVTTETLDFIYDSNGNPYALEYNGTTYYYITSLQGDVMYMVDANGATVATYEYDPFGKVMTASGAVAQINPLRYRGYYYDSETGFYYLQSRYYDPEICRFINADGLASTGQGFIGRNMFAYCLNNPISHADDGGHMAGSRTCTTVMMDGYYSRIEDGAKEFVEIQNLNNANTNADDARFNVDEAIRISASKNYVSVGVSGIEKTIIAKSLIVDIVLGCATATAHPVIGIMVGVAASGVSTLTEKYAYGDMPQLDNGTYAVYTLDLVVSSRTVECGGATYLLESHEVRTFYLLLTLENSNDGGNVVTYTQSFYTTETIVWD